MKKESNGGNGEPSMAGRPFSHANHSCKKIAFSTEITKKIHSASPDDIAKHLFSVGNLLLNPHFQFAFDAKISAYFGLFRQEKKKEESVIDSTWREPIQSVPDFVQIVPS